MNKEKIHICMFVNSRNKKICWNLGREQKRVIFVDYTFLCPKHERYCKRLEKKLVKVIDSTSDKR